MFIRVPACVEVLYVSVCVLICVALWVEHISVCDHVSVHAFVCLHMSMYRCGSIILGWHSEEEAYRSTVISQLLV